MTKTPYYRGRRAPVEGLTHSAYEESHKLFYERFYEHRETDELNGADFALDTTEEYARDYVRFLNV